MGLGPEICRTCWDDAETVAYIHRLVATQRKVCMLCRTEPTGRYFGLWQIKPGVHLTYHSRPSDFGDELTPKENNG